MKPLRKLGLAVLMSVLGVCWASLAHAGPVTFLFEGVFDHKQGPDYPFAIGQRVTGSYTFELNTPHSSPQWYNNAITDFTVQLAGYAGTGNGHSGSIFFGNPVEVSGSFHFFADYYQAQSLGVTGITIPSAFGTRRLQAAQIELQDLDQVGLSSSDLSPTPPDLTYFLDHAGTSYQSDFARLLLTFDFPDGGVNSVAFTLTSLAAAAPPVSVPEPATATLLLVASCGWLGWRCSTRRSPRS